MKTFQVEVLVKANVTAEVKAESEAEARGSIEGGLNIGLDENIHNRVGLFEPHIDMLETLAWAESEVDEQGGTK